MRRHLPPLNWLRAFEAAGRHNSFARAADELNVSPSAISQQIRSLEDHIGTSLFIRKNQGLSLSDAGAGLLPSISGGLDAMNAGMRDVYGPSNQNTLIIRTTITFANLWLVPKLDGFKATHPGAEFQIITSQGNSESADHSPADVDIFYAACTPPQKYAYMLLQDDLFPVAAPSLIANKGEEINLEGLHQFDLLTVNDYEFEWEMWLTKAGVTGVDLARGTSFDQSIMAIQAAINGKGIFLCHESMIREHLVEKRLIALFDIQLESPGAYWLASPNSKASTPLINNFIDWLKAEAAR